MAGTRNEGSGDERLCFCPQFTLLWSRGGSARQPGASRRFSACRLVKRGCRVAGPGASAPRSPSAIDGIRCEEKRQFNWSGLRKGALGRNPRPARDPQSQRVAAAGGGGEVVGAIERAPAVSDRGAFPAQPVLPSVSPSPGSGQSDHLVQRAGSKRRRGLAQRRGLTAKLSILGMMCWI
ncbi:hypothetical protein SKAU_G00297420 [Synaphobranchus kaupii]|uniref:Uncharacterized protein n=1 Tax=Synaphobranchus kaupii TaxID=118154 RepID=A0A9Q1EUY4_SYNKA|nr:hypothetical protein SKAU_G00297420 [Synaphobranchus kaupii]